MFSRTNWKLKHTCTREFFKDLKSHESEIDRIYYTRNDLYYLYDQIVLETISLYLYKHWVLSSNMPKI
jgi:hypothetical protein